MANYRDSYDLFAYSGLVIATGIPHSLEEFVAATFEAAGRIGATTSIMTRR